MSDDALKDRGRALEDAFFAAQSEQKLQKLREKMEAQSAREAIAEQTGIQDAELLDRVVALGIRPSTLSAFALVPLVRVAWADGVLDPTEREAILVEAKALGLQDGGTAMSLLAGWLDRKPDAALFEAWKAWYDQTVAGLDDDALLAMGERIMDNARRVARASGGVLGVGAVSAPERRVLDELAAVLVGE